MPASEKERETCTVVRTVEVETGELGRLNWEPYDERIQFGRSFKAIENDRSKTHALI